MRIDDIDSTMRILPFPYPIEVNPTQPPQEEEVDNQKEEKTTSDKQSSAYIKNKSAQRLQALPPHIQRQREEKAIREDERLEKLLDGETISSIEKAGDHYIIFTEKSFIRVDINYIPRKDGMVGPAIFELSFQDKKPYLG